MSGEGPEEAGAAREVRENLLALSRTGADLLITHHAEEAVREGWLA